MLQTEQEEHVNVLSIKRPPNEYVQADGRIIDYDEDDSQDQQQQHTLKHGKKQTANKRVSMDKDTLRKVIIEATRDNPEGITIDYIVDKYNQPRQTAKREIEECCNYNPKTKLYVYRE